MNMPIRLRDMVFLCHPKPRNKYEAETLKMIIENRLPVSDTWETALSGGADKKKTFERLIRERKLGYLALLRNLHNMAEADCDRDLINDAIIARRGAERVLPFRYTAAARAAPQFEPALDQALQEAIAALPRLSGLTAVLVDVSGSMRDPLSERSDLTRMDAAATLAAIIPGDVRVFSFSKHLIEVPPRKGMAGVDAIISSQPHESTQLISAVAEVNRKVSYDRIIVISDEQAHHDMQFFQMPSPKGRGYMINVAAYRNGVALAESKWVRIDGFSEHVHDFMREAEKAGLGRD